MNTNENTKKNNKKVKTITLLIILIVTVSLIGFAYARYSTRLFGESSAEIASWNFKVTAGSRTDLTIDLADTRLKDDTSEVKTTMIAPGTKGAVALNVEASGTRVGLVYNIDIDVSHIPENLKFYSDADMKKKVIVTDNKIQIEDFIGLNDSKKQTKTLYWDWPFESGESEFLIDKNDELDSNWMGESIELSIEVVGKQVSEKPVYLGDKVEIGDYVNYKATDETYTAKTNETGASTEKTFTSNESVSWRVLYVDKLTKTVELVSAQPTSENVILRGPTGYKNAVKILNEIGAIYGMGNGAASGRSINQDDIDQFSTFDKTNFRNANTYYGEDRTFTSGTFYNEDGSTVMASSNNPITMRSYYDEYNLRDYIENDTVLDMIRRSRKLWFG